MKKNFIIFMSLFLILLCCGCAEKPQENINQSVSNNGELQVYNPFTDNQLALIYEKLPELIDVNEYESGVYFSIGDLNSDGVYELYLTYIGAMCFTRTQVYVVDLINNTLNDIDMSSIGISPDYTDNASFVQRIQCYLNEEGKAFYSLYSKSNWFINGSEEYLIYIENNKALSLYLGSYELYDYIETEDSLNDDTDEDDTDENEDNPCPVIFLRDKDNIFCEPKDFEMLQYEYLDGDYDLYKCSLFWERYDTDILDVQISESFLNFISSVNEQWMLKDQIKYADGISSDVIYADMDSVSSNDLYMFSLIANCIYYSDDIYGDYAVIVSLGEWLDRAEYDYGARLEADTFEAFEYDVLGKIISSNKYKADEEAEIGVVYNDDGYYYGVNNADIPYNIIITNISDEEDVYKIDAIVTDMYENKIIENFTFSVQRSGNDFGFKVID